METQFGKFMDVVKNLQVTVPFTELITQIPAYAKFMKDILSRKRSLTTSETVAFTQECSTLLQGKSPPKLSDPGSFSIPCTIGTYVVDKALCDLGASVSIMPYSICEKLNMGSLKCTSITLQMADRSIKYPRGILEDVPVKIGKFFIPVDFIIVDMAEDAHIPIILGRPFLHTAGAVIDVKNGKLTLEVGDEKTVFTLNSTPKTPMNEETICSIKVNDSVLDTPPESPKGGSLDDVLLLDTCAGTGSKHKETGEQKELVPERDRPKGKRAEMKKTETVKAVKEWKVRKDRRKLSVVALDLIKSCLGNKQPEGALDEANDDDPGET